MIDTMVAAERSRGRFSDAILENSTTLLGFGLNRDLGIDYTEDLPDDFILQAWREKIKDSWSDANGSSQRQEYNEALQTIAHSRGSRELITALEEEKRNGMTPEKAYSTLEVPIGVEEEMLITIYNMRIEEQPQQLDNMRDALRVISIVTRSERLQKFLETGMDREYASSLDTSSFTWVNAQLEKW